MISTKFLIFILLFSIFVYIFMSTELKYYLNVFSDVQGYKFNFFKSQDNKLKLNSLLILSIFTWLLFFLGMEIVLGDDLYKVGSKSLVLIFLLYAMWSFAYFGMFEKSVKHLPVMLYDIFVTGLLSLVLTQIILNKYYKILEKNIPILVLLNFITMILFFYLCYKYNPDLSNIKGIYQQLYSIIFILLFIIFTYIFYKLK